MMPRKRAKLPPGVRFLTDAELEARRAAKSGAKAADETVQRAAGDGWSIPRLSLPKRRRGRRHRVPGGIFRRP